MGESELLIEPDALPLAEPDALLPPKVGDDGEVAGAVPKVGELLAPADVDGAVEPCVGDPALPALTEPCAEAFAPGADADDEPGVDGSFADEPVVDPEVEGRL